MRSFCLASLARAIDPATGLYNRQLRNRGWEGTWDTEDLTSTAICLIGIDRFGADVGELNLDPARTLDAMAELAKRHRYDGGAGLVIWANAVWDGLPLDELLAKAGFSFEDFDNFAPPLTSMETAWLVSGLVHELKRTGDATTEDRARTAVAELLDRFREETRIMLHATDAAPLSHRMRRNVANFADQIYSVQALSFAGIVLEHSTATDTAEKLADRLVELQGNLGQWWWHYDPRDGGVAQAYPVYAVHQHGMAPMALAALRAAGRTDYTQAAELGRAWLKRNELNMGMIDDYAQTIWRDIEYQENKAAGTIRKFRSVVGWKGEITAAAEDLVVNYETRPYEWAWCLYADAIEHGTDQKRHIV